LNGHEVNRRIAGRGAAAALIAAAVTLISFGPADAQGFMRTPNFNVGSRTPSMIPRMNPNIAGRAIGNTAVARRGADANNAPIVRRAPCREYGRKQDVCQSRSHPWPDQGGYRGCGN
jgi:hypothetical protein